MKGPQLIKPKSRNLKVNWLRRSCFEGRGGILFVPDIIQFMDKGGKGEFCWKENYYFS